MTNDNGKSGMTPTESRTTGTVGHVSHGSRETPATSASSMETDRSEKARGHKSKSELESGLARKHQGEHFFEFISEFFMEFLDVASNPRVAFCDLAKIAMETINNQTKISFDHFDLRIVHRPLL